MTALIADLSPSVTASASEANLCSAWADIGCPLPGGLHDGPDMQRIVSGLPSAFWNAVYRARFAAETVDAQIEDVLEPFRQRSIPMFWWLTSSSSPANLGSRLEAHGLTRDAVLTDMAADLHSLPPATAPSGLVIAEVGDRECLLQAHRVLMAGFTLPDEIAVAMTERMTRLGYGHDRPWRYFLAALDGRPVATAALLLRHGVAGIYSVATVPSAQRQGFGSAVTLAAMRAGRECGYRTAILHATDMGLPVYRRLGFVEQYQIDLYRWSG